MRVLQNQKKSVFHVQTWLPGRRNLFKNIIVLVLLFSIDLYTAFVCRAQDRFRSFDELRSVFQENIHYEIYTQQGVSGILVTAIHGGNIEPGSDVLAARIARSEHSLYLFKGLLPEEQAWDLHITSTRFDEPRATELVSQSHLCVSVHGYSPDQSAPPTILLGGRNLILKEKVREHLRVFQNNWLGDLIVSDAEGLFAGMSEKNIANQATFKGVQIELSAKLRQQIMASERLMDLLAKSIRAAIIDIEHEVNVGCSGYLEP